MPQQYDNEKRGALFKNKVQREDQDPDYRGNIQIDGKQYWLDAWITKSKSGMTFMSLRAKPKMAQEHQGAAKNPPPRDDYEGPPF